MPREDRIHDLRHDCVVVADDARKYRDALAEPRRCAVKGLWRNSPRVRAKLMLGTSEGDSLMRIIPPHRLLLCQMSRTEEKIPCRGTELRGLVAGNQG